jgi:hypothetical protein
MIEQFIINRKQEVIEIMALLNRGMKIKNSISETLNLCAFA